MDWKQELAQYLTGEVNKYDASTFYLKHKNFNKKTGYNMLGQYQGDDPDGKYYVWVGIQNPEGVDNLEATNNAAVIFSAHSDFFPGVKVKQAYSEGIGRYGIIFVMDNDPDGFVKKINDIVILNKKPEGGGDTNKYIVIGLAVATAVLLVAYLLKGGRK